MADSLDGKHAASDEKRRSFQDSRMSDSLSTACDYYHDPFCEVCSETKNRNIKHEGFCKDCVQFLCEDCLRVHRKLQAARGHVIQKGDDNQWPTSRQSLTSAIFINEVGKISSVVHTEFSCADSVYH